MDKADFKRELRGKIHDFSTSCALTNLSVTKPASQKEKEIEERYLRLENWIIAHSEIMDEIPINEDLLNQEELGF